MAASTGEWVASTTWVRGRRAISASSATRCSWAANDSPASGSSMTNRPSPRNRRVPSSDTNDSPCDSAWKAGSVTAARDGVEPGEQPVHRLGPHEVAPPRRPGVAHHGEPLVQRRLARVGAVGGAGRAALGVHARRHRERLDEGRLARAVLADEHRAAREVEPVGQHLRDRRDRERPDVGCRQLGVAGPLQAAGRQPLGPRLPSARHAPDANPPHRRPRAYPRTRGMPSGRRPRWPRDGIRGRSRR